MEISPGEQNGKKYYVFVWRNGTMSQALSAPRTRLEWGIFVGLLLAFYTVVMFLTTGDILSSLAMAVIAGLPFAGAIVVVVAAWRIVTDQTKSD